MFGAAKEKVAEVKRKMYYFTSQETGARLP